MSNVRCIDFKKLSEFYRIYSDEFSPEETETLESLWFLVDRGSTSLMVSELDGKVCAGAVYDVLAGSVFVEYLVVSKENRRKGIASSLLRSIMEENPGKDMYVEVDKGSAESTFKFWEAEGFKPICREGYVQPPLRAGADPAYDLELHAKVSGKVSEVKVRKDVVDYFREAFLVEGLDHESYASGMKVLS